MVPSEELILLSLLDSDIGLATKRAMREAFKDIEKRKRNTATIPCRQDQHHRQNTG